MNLLVLAALTDATGNAVTARRIASHLEAAHRVMLADANGASASSLRKLVAQHGIHAAVGVHALLAGPFLRAVGLPYALVFGGTDLYEKMHPLQEAQMARSVAGAARLVAFSPENIARAEWMWPEVRGRVELLPQAVEIPPPEASFSLRRELGIPDGDALVLLPTGIRRVKDPLHVVDAFSAWHAVHPRVHLAIAGALLEPDYVDGALATFEARPGVHFVGALPRPRMLAAIREADVVLNTSLGEGMCGVLLEAMALGTPVVARRNAGNESLVAHGHTGLLYDTPTELVHWVSALVGSPELSGHLAGTARRRIDAAHAPVLEAEAYLRLASELEGASRPSQLPPAARAVDELSTLAAAGERVGLDGEALEIVESLVVRIRESEALEEAVHRVAGLLATAPPSVAIGAFRAFLREHAGAREDAAGFGLVLALHQVASAEARHRARGIEPAITRASLGDVAAWSDNHRELTGHVGLSIDMLEFLQRTLRGELVRLGPLQFDLRPFAAPLRVRRHRETRALRGERIDGRAVDLARGTLGNVRAAAHEAEWELVLEPGTPMLEMWIPMGARITLRDVASSMRDALAHFERLAPETSPHGVYGESWRLDVELAASLPHDPGVHDLQRVVSLYPVDLVEAKTIRRLFGPDVTREGLATRAREPSSATQRFVAGYLDDPTHRLLARGGFVLREELAALPEWS